MSSSHAELAAAAVEAALAAGASYADARIVQSKSSSQSARDHDIESVRSHESLGLGVRALVDSAWGFQAVSELDEARVGWAGAQAVRIAAASRRLPGPPLVLDPRPALTSFWRGPCQIDPESVSLAARADYLVGLTDEMMGVAGVVTAEASLSTWFTHKWLVTSDGISIEQELHEAGAHMSATSTNGSETQRRSFPGVMGQYGSGGYELIEALQLEANAGRIAEEAVALLSAPDCPAGVTDLILTGSQLALQIHESVGHAVELDRILGWEAGFAGTSFLELAELGRLRYGSPLMNVIADAGIPGAAGTFGFDDEGTPAHRVDIVSEGVWTGVLSGRDSAAVAGLASSGALRADGFARLPMVRMTNIGLLPGNSSLEEIIQATEEGILMDTNRSWSIDDRRLNFQFGCELAYEIKGGRRGRMLRNPTYTGITPTFWGSMDMLAGESEWVVYGVNNCGKGQPEQIAHTGHPASPARFKGVRVGVRG